MKSRHVITALLLLLTFAAGYSFSQNQLPGTQKFQDRVMGDASPSELASKLSQYELLTETLGDSQKDGDGTYIRDYIGAMYIGVGRDNDTAKESSNAVYKQFLREKIGGRSAVQVSQLADEERLKLELIQIGQNQKIISLLEKIANKK